MKVDVALDEQIARIERLGGGHPGVLTILASLVRNGQGHEVLDKLEATRLDPVQLWKAYNDRFGGDLERFAAWVRRLPGVQAPGTDSGD